jgi:AhpD family alkylhydroperoxidase
VTSVRTHKDATVQARMNLPAIVLPDAMPALHALWKVTTQGGMPHATLDLVSICASQINGCSTCLDMHVRLAKKDRS